MVSSIIRLGAATLLAAWLLLAPAAALPGDTVTQFSTINALLAGAYDGRLACRDLLRHGNLGLGTFAGLDGEMVVLNGQVFQIKSDGKVYRPDLGLTTPFAAVVDFAPDKTLTAPPGLDFPGLEKLVDEALPNQNLFGAILLKGRFKNMKTRSVPAQQKPYPPLVEVAKQQPVFHFADIAGTLVGFRAPKYTKDLTVPGYHLHFLSADGGAGGHVLAFTLESGKLEVDSCHRFLLILPENDGAFGGLDLEQDRSRELHQVEK